VPGQAVQSCALTRADAADELHVAASLQIAPLSRQRRCARDDDNPTVRYYFDAR
jgi:hypothetical protein